MHKEVIDFCTRVRNRHPKYFKGQKVLEVGSLDINGTIRSLFTDCNYTGIDIGEGKGVDKVCLAHEMKGRFKTIISTETFEHDMYWQESILNIKKMLYKGGLFLFTCATTGRPEHGTNERNKGSAPLLEGEWGDYYRNLTREDVEPLIEDFKEYKFTTIKTDLQFWGIK